MASTTRVSARQAEPAARSWLEIVPVPRMVPAASLRLLAAWGNIRPMPNRVRHPVFSPWVYRQRNAVERFFNKLKHFRGGCPDRC